MDDERVHFADEGLRRERVGAAFDALRAEIARLVPRAEIEHIGSTSIPGSITKGDLDVCVRVEPTAFAAAERALATRFAPNVGSDHTASLASFVDAVAAIPTGVQLVARGGPEDFFGAWRDLLATSPRRLAAYNALKRRWHGGSHDGYRAEKAAFIERELAEARAIGVWLQIPARDYERHMADVGQSAALRAFFTQTYAERRPRRLAVLGCTTGADLALIEPFTDAVVGIDVNAAYLAVARRRLAALGARLELIQGDVLDVALPAAPFDLVHAALLLEYVDPAALFRRVAGWLAPGGACSVVTQEPAPDAPPVSHTAYASLQLLDGCLSLRAAGEVARAAASAGLRAVITRTTRLPSGKSLTSTVFERSPVAHP